MEQGVIGLNNIFYSIKSFVQDLQRRFGLYNFHYVECILEGLDQGLDICLGSVSCLVFNEALGTTNHSEEDGSEI